MAIMNTAMADRIATGKMAVPTWATQTPTSTTTAVDTTSGNLVVPNTPAAAPSVAAPSAAPATPTTTSPANSAVYNLENDPVYQSAMLQGQSAFNVGRANALANMQNETTGLNRQNTNIEQGAEQSRRQLAGNFAARGMQRGAYGAYYRAQDAANAQQIAQQTDIKDQIATLNQNFLSNYGAIGTDWTGTTIGQQYRNQALQQALAAKLATYGVA